MKLTILGAGGFRTPLLIQSLYKKLLEIGFDSIALYDTDQNRLRLVKAMLEYAVPQEILQKNIYFAQEPVKALQDANFVITTFRVGGMESRVTDERIALKYGILGQETTGPGGFSMAMRTIPVMLEYLKTMREVCPNAWIINFANPSGLLTEAIIKLGNWQKVIGICDGPESMRLFIADYMQTDEKNVSLEYFGLNHMGWIRKILVEGSDILPEFIHMLNPNSKLPGLPFSGQLVKSLNMIPNEYLYYYYYRQTAVAFILKEEKTRGEYLLELNKRLETELSGMQSKMRLNEMWEAYWSYLDARTETYMHNIKESLPVSRNTESHLGYANVAFNVISGLLHKEVNAIVNVPNLDAITGMSADDVVEIPVKLKAGNLEREHIGEIPIHPRALIQQVKEYERLTIEGIRKHSYAHCLQALTIHPLVMDEVIAKQILDEYIQAFAGMYPALR